MVSPSGPCTEAFRAVTSRPGPLDMASQENSASKAPSRGTEKKKLKNLTKFSGLS